MLARSFIVMTGFLMGLGMLEAMSSAVAQGYSQQQQQLCSGDAFRLCGPEIPDVDRVTACMIRQRAQLSPGCQSVFRPAPVAAAKPVRLGRPANLRPKTARMSKTQKAKKARR